MEDIVERIGKVISTTGFARSRFAKTIGVSESTLRFVMHRQNSPSLGVITKVADAYNINLDWLITGNGKMYNEIEPESESAALSYIKESIPIMCKKELYTAIELCTKELKERK